MSSNKATAGPFTSSSAGGAGQGGTGAVPPGLTVSRGPNAPRQSTALQARLKEMRKNMERLMAEKKDLKQAREALQQVVAELDAEIEKVQGMAALAERAHTFQNMGEMGAKWNSCG